MKKLFLVFAIMMISISSFSQKITYKFNDMTAQCSYYFYPKNSNKVYCIVSQSGKTGFILFPSFKEDLEKKLVTSLTFNSITVCFFVKGMLCVKRGSLIINFTDHTSIELRSFNKYNCEDYFFFSLSKKQKTKLASIPIYNIMLSDFSSGYIYAFSPDNPYFFLELDEALRLPYTKAISKRY